MHFVTDRQTDRRHYGGNRRSYCARVKLPGKVQDVGFARPPTDRALFQENTQNIWWQKLCCCQGTGWNSLPVAYTCATKTLNIFGVNWKRFGF